MRLVIGLVVLLLSVASVYIFTPVSQVRQASIPEKMSKKIREIARIVQSHKQREGGGFMVRRPVPSKGMEQVDPFLLIDEFGPVDYAPGEAVGAPDHPHRGFETVSYLIEGEFEHEDSAGHRGTIRAGDVQWMTAGAGIVHSEMPSEKIQKHGGRLHGFQIWVNLPKALKMTRPRYQEVPAEKLPKAKTADGLASVTIVAGEALGVKAAIATHTPIIYQDWTLSAGADVSLSVPEDHNAVVYVFSGSVQIGNDNSTVADGQMGIMGPGEEARFRVSAGGSARFLLLAGRPHNEPLARYGPFVMNTDHEIAQAMTDYRSGMMGEITRSAEITQGSNLQ